VNDGSLLNTGAPMEVRFACADEDLAAVGMYCADDDRCPVYLELSGVSAAGKKLLLAGNLHSSSATLYSILLMSGDGGAAWKEPIGRTRGAALDQVQMLDSMHGWAAGETQYPLARDPFVVMTTDGGDSWRQKTIIDEGDAGSVQTLWFDSISHGELVIDAGRASPGSRYMLYDSGNGGESWKTVSKTAQIPRVRRPLTAESSDYRISTDSNSRANVVERRVGEKWTRVASFLVQIASCGSKPVRPAADPDPRPTEPPADAR
jgi:hypothetical protein